MDFSSRLSIARYRTRLAQHLDRHRITPRTLEAWALRFREVVVDMRAVRAGRLQEFVFEFEPCIEASKRLAQGLKRICQAATEFMHVDSRGFLQAEHECRGHIGAAIATVVSQVVHYK